MTPAAGGRRPDWIRRLGLALLVLGAAATGAHARCEVIARDDLGRVHHYAAPPRRIVSLMPSLTETVCALDACARLVGADRYSNWPPEVRAVPKTGGLDDPNVEQIVALRPDLVLLGRSSAVRERLEALGLATFVIEPTVYPDIARTITLLGAVLGAPARAAALCAAIGHDVARLEAAAHRPGAPAPSVYFEVDSTPYAAGPASFIGELLARLGARNILPAALGPFPKLNPEFVVTHDPDVILLGETPSQPLAARPGWGALRAVRGARVCTFTAAEQDTLLRPGPRVAAGMRALADCLARAR